VKVKEIIQQILQKKFRAQSELAARLGVVPSDIQRLASAGRNQEKQFQLFLGFMTICSELGIDPYAPSAQELNKDIVVRKALQDEMAAVAQQKGTLEDFESHDRTGEDKNKKRITSIASPRRAKKRHP